MPNKYLLPCKCGRKHPVEPAQAGDQLVCNCGDTLPVPTLLEMRKLEQVQSANQVGPTSWSVKHRTFVIGVVIFLVGTALLAFFWSRRPEPPDDATKRRFVERVVQSAPPLELIRMFQAMRNEGLQPGRDKDIKMFFEWRRRYNMAMAGGLGVALAGVVIIGCSLLMSGKVRVR